MRTKTFSAIMEQHRKLWIASLGNKNRCDKLDCIYLRYLRAARKYFGGKKWPNRDHDIMFKPIPKNIFK